MVITLFASIPVIFILSYLILKPRFSEWSAPDRGFVSFEKEWPKIFLVAGAGAELLAIATFWLTGGNVAISLLVATIGGLLGIAAWTDARTSRVPLELSSLTKWVGFVMGMVALFVAPTGGTYAFTETNADYFPLIQPEHVYYFTAAGVAALLIGFLVWVRKTGIVGMVGIIISALGLYFALYAPITLLTGLEDPYWGTIAYRLACVVTLLAVSYGFDFAVGNMIGGADTVILYTITWAFSWFIGPYFMFVVLLAAFMLQIVVHIFAKKLNIGTNREMPNGPIKAFFVKRKWVKAGNSADTVPAKHMARAVPFLPVMVPTIIIGVMTVILNFASV